MTIVPVENLPEKRPRDYKRIAHIFQEFMKMNVKYARVDFNELEYASVQSAYTNLRRAATDQNRPLYVTIINGEIYFVRMDMED